jgi:DNA-binding MurR/RpiR family transcriptional regulator
MSAQQNDWPSMNVDEVSPLAGKIAGIYETLSRQERQLADTVLEHVRDLAGYTATELAEQAKVSKATATRLFRRLGYQGFEAARLEARRPRLVGSPLEALVPEGTGHSDEAMLGVHLAREVRNLTETFGGVSVSDLTQATTKLAEARKVWVVGFRDNYALAVYARAMLVRVIDSVALIPGDGASYAEDLIGLGTRDAILAIGFRRRPRMFAAILKLAETHGTPVILLTEPEMRSTTGAHVIALRCWIAGSVFDSHAAGLSVLNLICSRVVRTIGPDGKARLEDAERIHRQLNDLPTSSRPSH